MNNYPIIDLHCDLLTYLAHTPNSSIHHADEIGVALPHLQSGNVKHQVLAIFTPTQKGSVAFAQKEIEAYQKLLQEEYFYPIVQKSDISKITTSKGIGVTVALESASGLCEEDEPLDLAFHRLDQYLEVCEHLYYISFTHHPENRFGGGNYSNNIGLKADGKVLLDYMNGKKIAVDLAHSSDNLAYDIINYVDANSLDIPIIASHSNFRVKCDHVRNLPNELVQELVKRKGLIGINFLRAYVHDTDPNHLIEHILHGLQSDVALDHLTFGADFFDLKALEERFPDRVPFFFEAHENASKYPSVLKDVSARGVNDELLKKLSYQNAIDFMERTW